jgi:hypothetical protein
MKARLNGMLEPTRVREALPLVILLILGLAIGLSFGNDYGVTYDEKLNATNGAAALRAYQGSDEYFGLPALPDHGPVYFMIMSLSSDFIEDHLRGWSRSDGRHLTHFLMFLLASAAFYCLCLRLAGRTAAWMATVLFFTQPLLLGYGFISQKDTPFMAFFLATFVTGLAAGDRLARPRPSAGDLRLTQKLGPQILHEWRGLARGAKGFLIGTILVLTLLVLDLVWLGTLQRLGESLITTAYAGRAPALLQGAFNLFASDAHKTPLPYYLDQYRSHAVGLRLPLAALAIVAALVVFGAFLPSLRDSIGLKGSSLSNPALWVSAVLLGATVCVRQLGLFVGGLVSLYLLARVRSRAVIPLIVYWGLAAIVTYITWPYLWSAPVEKFVESFRWAAGFPSYDVFFEGRWVTAETRPWYYLPKLAALQLTEPAVLLSLIGAGLVIRQLRTKPADRIVYLLLALWIGVPAFGVMVLDMTVYGNIRHLLFMLPAVLALTALPFAWLVRRARRAWLPWVAFLLAILPGIATILYLHPYEYIYLNRLTGGVSGGFERYELDHECTSVREGIEAANRIVPSGSQMLLIAMAGDVRQYARPDLLAPAATSIDAAQYVLVCNWPETLDLRAEGFRTVYAVQRGNAILSALWER